MNFTTQLSIKSALRFALPCLAASLLFTACSNEDAETTPEYNDSVNPTVRFSASAPLNSEVASTRIGINDATKPTVGNYEQAEPVIWIADDEVSIVFVQGGNRVYAKFKVDGETISDDGTSAELVSVDIPTTLNGEYTVYAITPYTTQTANQFTFDLSSQTQSVGHTNYNHLGNSTIMRAAGKPATFTNGSTSSVVNFEFEYLTSFLRFHITNDLGKSITVTGINLSHPDLISGSRFNYVQNNLNQPTKKDLSLQFGAGHTLSPNAAFDSYFSAFPLEAPEGHLSLTVNYTDGEGAKEKPFSIPINELSSTGRIFPEGSRFVFEIILSPSALVSPPYEIDGFYVTKNGNVNSNDQVTVGDITYTHYDTSKTDYCSDGYVLLDQPFLSAHFPSDNTQWRRIMRRASMAERYYFTGQLRGQDAYYWPLTSDALAIYLCYMYDDNQWSTPNVTVNRNQKIYLDLRCVKKIN